MEIRAAEISAILKDQIANFDAEADVSEVGQVLSVSLSPDARTLALQVAVQGRWRLELVDLGAILEPDRSAGERFSGPLQPTP